MKRIQIKKGFLFEIILFYFIINNILNFSSDQTLKKSFHWKEWFYRKMFYQYGIVYMCTRLCYNISQNLLVFFLIFTLRVQEPSKTVELSIYLAIFPLIIYLSSCVGSFLSGKFFQKFGRKKTFCIGTLNLIISAVVMTVIIYFLLLHFLFI